MNCKNHPAVAAMGRCEGCAEDFCKNCLVEIHGQHYCGSCKIMTLKGRTPVAAMAVSERNMMTCPAAKQALIFAVISVFCAFGAILGWVAMAKGFEAKRQIDANGQMAGREMAIAAIIVGPIIAVTQVVLFISNMASRAGMH